MTIIELIEVLEKDLVKAQADYRAAVHASGGGMFSEGFHRGEVHTLQRVIALFKEDKNELQY